MNPTNIVWLQLIGLLAVEAAVIVGIAAQLQRLTNSSIWRRTIWHGCTLSLLLLVVFEFTGTARSLVGWIGRKPVSEPLLAAEIPNAKSLVSSGQIVLADQLRAEIQLKPGNHATLNSQPAEIPDMRDAAFKANVAAPRNSIAKRISSAVAMTESISIVWIGLIWMAGAGVVIGRALISRIVLEVFRWQRKRVDHVEICESVQALALNLGIQRPVRLMESARIFAPVAFGILRPTIGLPLQFGRKFDLVKREAMLAHELAHLAGKDPAWYLLADVLAAALWWHPLIWWSRRQLHAQSELAADEASLLVANGPNVLAECLVELGARLAQSRSFVPLGIGGSGYRSGLGRRVERLVKLEGAVWRPPNRIRCGLAEAIVPVVLVAATILCTAWAVPPALTKGENMQTMKQTWRRTLAAFALLSALGSDANPALSETTEPQTAAKPEAAALAATTINTSGGSSAGYSAAGPRSSFTDRLVRIGPGAKVSKERQLIEERLNQIILPTVKYDQLPLGEVINNLVEETAQRDPNKQAINFVLNREMPASTALPGAIDPTTGLPVASPPVEAIDLSSITIKIIPALKNVRLIDVLNVITKTAERPIHYSIEDYGVLFSQGESKPGDWPGFSARHEPVAMTIKTDTNTFQTFNPFPGPMAMEVMTFKLDKTTFFPGVERTFGMKLSEGKTDIKDVIKDLFKELGIAEKGDNKIFYNDLNGVLMVRGTHETLAVAKGVIETLGGVPYSQTGISFGGGGGGSGAGGGGGSAGRP